MSNDTFASEKSRSENQNNPQNVEKIPSASEPGSTIEALPGLEGVFSSALVTALRLHKTLLLLGYIYANQFIMKLATNKLHSHTG